MKKIALLLLMLIISCSVQQNKNVYLPIAIAKNHTTNYVYKEGAPKSWSHKDIVDDTIIGISLEKAHQQLLSGKKAIDITIAILDSQIDINHPLLKNHIWKNPAEIANNDIDDDQNGYVDDINGWNFLGHKNGESTIYANNEYVRIVRFYNDKFKGKLKNEISNEEIENYFLFMKANSVYEKNSSLAEKKFKHAEKIFNMYLEAKEALKAYFPKANFTLEKINAIDTIGNGLHKHVEEIKLELKYNETDASMNRTFNNYKISCKKYNNINYNERKIIGDDPNDLSDINYGNNNISDYVNVRTHGTRVAGVILENSEKCKTKHLNIMPVCISPNGENQDKDIALGIKYAVDNGAKVINMSFGKTFSLHTNWVHEAFMYAEKNNVLIVSSAGNGKLNLNEINDYYPNDNINNGKEVSDNFILVGASSYQLNENLYVSYSNYGNIDVDVFAPGGDIYTIWPNAADKIDGGTSLAAALVSRVAGLIFSYYPELTASQVKQIIMKSGLEFTIPVNISKDKTITKMTPFNQLSKSGRIVNAYNALIMAEEISKK